MESPCRSTYRATGVSGASAWVTTSVTSPLRSTVDRRSWVPVAGPATARGTKPRLSTRKPEASRSSATYSSAYAMSLGGMAALQ